MLIKFALLVLALESAHAQQAGHAQPQLQYRLAQAQAAAAAAAAAQEQTSSAGQQQYAQQQYAQQQYSQQQYAQEDPAQYAQPSPQPQYTAVDARQIARLRAAQAQAAQGGRAATAPRAQYQPDPEDYDPNPQYQFSFDVKDDEFTNYQNRKEQREGGKISGSYSVVDADGFIRTVKYTADPKEGFKAEVTREPTDIVVKVPQPPAPQPQQLQGLSATQRQLQTHQYLQGTLGVQPPQSQLYASLTQLPKRLPHAGAQGAPAPAPSQAPVRVQYAPAPSPVRYTAQPQAQQYSPAQAQQYSSAQAQPQYSSAQAQQYTAQQYQLASASSAAAQAEARPIKAGAIGFATQEPNGGSVVYQAYQQ